MLTPGGPSIGVGAMAAGYGGSGESLTFQTAADFSFTTETPEEFYLGLNSNASSGVGFDTLMFEVTVNGAIEALDTFTSLNVAEAFFSGNALDLGAWGAGGQTVDISTWLTASEPGADFGFDYALALSPDAALASAGLAAPEPSTWAMMLSGFASLGFAGYRRARRGRVASQRHLPPQGGKGRCTPKF